MNIKRILAAALSLAIMNCVMGTTANAENLSPIIEEDQEEMQNNSTETKEEGTFKDGATYNYDYSLMRIHGGSITPEEFYVLAVRLRPKFLWITSSDISGTEDEVNEFLQYITSGYSGIEAILVIYKDSSPIIDKYNRMIDTLTAEAKENGDDITATDMRFRHKMFFFDKSTSLLTGPDGVICENCGYIDFLQMKDYPNNKEPIAAPKYVEPVIPGDANLDGKLTVRDCSYKVNCLSVNKAYLLPDTADFNMDGLKDVRDAAGIAHELSKIVL